MKKKGHKQSFTVLFVPDDNSEPTNFKISIRNLKLFLIVGIIVGLHLITGFIFYFLFFSAHREKRQLKAENTKLLLDNKRVYKLAAEFNELEQSQLKIRRALGIDKNLNETGSPSAANKMNELTDQMQFTARDERPGSAEAGPAQPSNRNAGKNLTFVNQSKSIFHEIASDMPTLLPVEGFISAEFSANPATGGREHYGIDIAAPRRSIIQAAGSGIVVFSNWTYDLGNLLIIYHGNGIFTYYGHAMLLLKSERALVKKGEPIAWLGSTGISSAPHLHFEIWRDGEPVDPTEYILALQQPNQK